MFYACKLYQSWVHPWAWSFMWLCHDRLVSITAPRFLTSLICLRFVYPIRRLLALSAATFFSCGSDPKVITWVLAVFIVRWFFTIQSSRAIRSNWSIVAALCWSSSWYDASIWVSSAYITTLLLMCCGDFHPAWFLRRLEYLYNYHSWVYLFRPVLVLLILCLGDKSMIVF